MICHTHTSGHTEPCKCMPGVFAAGLVRAHTALHPPSSSCPRMSCSRTLTLDLTLQISSITHPTKATTATAPAGTAREEEWGPFQTPRLRLYICPLSLHSQTWNLGLYAPKIRPFFPPPHPQKKNLAGMMIITNAADQVPAPMSSTCILKAIPAFWCVLLTHNIKSNGLSSLPSIQITAGFH